MYHLWSAEGSNFYRVVLISLVFLCRHGLILKMDDLVNHMLLADEEAGPGHILRTTKHTEIRLSGQ